MYESGWLQHEIKVVIKVVSMSPRENIAISLSDRGRDLALPASLLPYIGWEPAPYTGMGFYDAF